MATEHYYDNFEELLKAVHEQVQKVGVGQAQVHSADDPMRLLLGYNVMTSEGVTKHQIKLMAFKSVAWAPSLSTVEDREQLAKLLAQGELPEFKE